MVAVSSLGAMSGLFLSCSNQFQTASDLFNTSNSGDNTTNSEVIPGGSCTTSIPNETAGPFPAHDDSAVNCLRLNGIVRSDIRTSLGSGSYTGTATAPGIPLNLKFSLAQAGSCTPLVGYAVYLWHADASGKYSMYSSGITSQTFLRGVQTTDSKGELTFTTIVPGCYEGRYPHMHFDIFPSLSLAVDNNNVIKTSQLTFPESTLDACYATSSYSSSLTPYSRVSLTTDGIFSDGYSYQMANSTGNTSTGYNASILVAI